MNSLQKRLRIGEPQRERTRQEAGRREGQDQGTEGDIGVLLAEPRGSDFEVLQPHKHLLPSRDSPQPA